MKITLVLPLLATLACTPAELQKFEAARVSAAAKCADARAALIEVEKSSEQVCGVIGLVPKVPGLAEAKAACERRGEVTKARANVEYLCTVIE